MPATPIEDWTRGPAKWAAVVVLALAGVGTLAWAFVRASDGPARVVHDEADTSGTMADAARERERPAVAASEPEPETSLETADDPARGSGGEALGPPTPSTSAESEPADSTPAAIEPKPAEPAPASASRKINLNTASSAELELLPGIGPALAQRILADRARLGKFRNVDDLDRVPGIGPRTIDKLRALVIAE